MRLAWLVVVCISCSSSAGESSPDASRSDVSADSFELPPSPGDAEVTGILFVQPSSPLLFVTIGEPAPSVAFNARLRFADGSERDVTSGTTFAVDDPAAGTFTGTVFHPNAMPAPDVTDRISMFSAAHGAARTTGAVVVTYVRPPRDAIFTQSECSRVAPFGPGSDVIKFTGEGRDHRVTVVPGEDAALVLRVEAIEGVGCDAIARADSDGDGIPDTFRAAPVGSTLCYRVIPDAPRVALARRVQFRVARVGLDGGERGHALFLIAPRGGPPC